MDYSVASALFFSVPVAVVFLVLSQYVHRRTARLIYANDKAGIEPTVRTRRRKYFIFYSASILIVLCCLLLVDNFWDNFRHAYNILPRAVDALLVFGFVSIGVTATFLTIAIGIIEVYDRLRNSASRARDCV